MKKGKISYFAINSPDLLKNPLISIPLHLSPSCSSAVEKIPNSDDPLAKFIPMAFPRNIF